MYLNTSFKNKINIAFKQRAKKLIFQESALELMRSQPLFQMFQVTNTKWHQEHIDKFVNGKVFNKVSVGGK